MNKVKKFVKKIMISRVVSMINFRKKRFKVEVFWGVLGFGLLLIGLYLATVLWTEKYSLATQAYFTVILAASTFLLALSTWRSVEVTREQMQASLRPIVGIALYSQFPHRIEGSALEDEVERFEATGETTTGYTLYRGDFFLANDGVGPALNIECRVGNVGEHVVNMIRKQGMLGVNKKTNLGEIPFKELLKLRKWDFVATYEDVYGNRWESSRTLTVEDGEVVVGRLIVKPLPRSKHDS